MRKIFDGALVLLALSLTLFAVGCGSSESSTATTVEVEADTTPPTVTYTSPAADDMDAAVDTMVAVTFSEALDATTVDGATLTLLAAGETTPVTATIAYDDGLYQVTCDPYYQLAPSTTYAATLVTTVADLAGNLLADGLTYPFDALTWSFTTGADLVAPDVTAVFPADGSVASAVTIASATYSETLNVAPTDGAMTLTCGGVDVTGTASYADLTQATFTPDASLTVGDSCTATFFATLTDAAANSGEATATWSFTVDYPRITGTPVAAGPMGAGTPVEITVPINAAAECVTVGLLDGMDSVGSGANCVASPGDTEIVVSVNTDPGPGGDYVIAVQVDHSNGPPVSDYFFDDTVSADNYTWSTSGITPEDSGIPLGMVTLEPLPDLTVAILDVTIDGSDTFVNYEVCNIGFGDTADSFEVGIFIDPVTTPQLGDTPDITRAVAALTTGGCATDYVQVATPLTGRFTDYYAMADSAQDVTEPNEANNVSAPYTVPTGVAPETYTGSSLSQEIPDAWGGGPGVLQEDITVTSIAALDDIVVTIDITHTYVSDLDIYLVSPLGTTITLSNDNGGGSDDYTMTVFDDTAATSINSGSAPFTGTYRPDQPLSTFAGENPNGTWILRIEDDSILDTGTIWSWSIGIW